MLKMRFLLPLVSTALLAGCSQPQAASNDGFAHGNGRYVGIGVYPTNELWTQINLPKPDKVDPAAATLGDDKQIIVVVDTRTGEVRQCGDMSGLCTQMNPWEQRPDVSQQQPVKLKKHAADLAREANEEVETQAGKAAR